MSPASEVSPARQGRTIRRVVTTSRLASLSTSGDRELIAAGVDVVEHSDAAGMLVSLLYDAPDVVVAEATPHGVEIQTLVEAVHNAGQIPVVVGITAGDEGTVDAAKALDAGANALIALPFTAESLKRTLAGLGLHSSPLSAPIVLGDLSIDFSAHRVTVHGREVRLTHREFSILHMIASRAPRLVSPVDIARQFTTDRDDETGARAVRVMIGSIRAKLAVAHPEGESPIETVRGVGYRIRELT